MTVWYSLRNYKESQGSSIVTPDQREPRSSNVNLDQREPTVFNCNSRPK